MSKGKKVGMQFIYYKLMKTVGFVQINGEIDSLGQLCVDYLHLP